MDKSSIFNKPAKTILSNPTHNLFITSKNISEFFAVTSKRKISYKSSSNYYEEIKNKATILYPTEGSLVFLEYLLQKYHPKGNRVFDMEIVSIMLDNQIEQIATFNRKDFLNISEVQIIDN